MDRLLLLVCLFLATALPGQRPMARIVMKDGTTVIGAILRESEDAIILRVGTRPHVVRVADIEDLEPVKPGAISPGIYPPTQAPATPGPLPPPSTAEPTEELEDIGAAAIDQIFRPEGGPSQLVDRYLWQMPKATSTRISLALGLWLFLGCLLHLSTVVIGVRNTSMLRAQLMALVVVVIAAVQALVPFQGLQVLIFVGLDVVLWLLVARLFYHFDAGRSLWMLLCASFLVLITVLFLLVARYLVETVQTHSI
ncbi:MAG: hypothetical protein ACYTGW_08175 [Planctomycetota bacterium]